MRPTLVPWCPPPTQLALSPTTIDIWHLDLHCSAPKESLLSAAEQARAARLRIAEKRRQFVVGRTLLRQVLGRYLQRSPQELCFSYGPQGKPCLDDGALDFNLAHSGPHGLLAVSCGGPLGVDVEVLAADVDWRGVASRFFTPEECAQLAGVAPHRQRRAFYRLWTRKEALLKGDGQGFLAAVGVRAVWQVRSFSLGQGALGALAWQQQVNVLRRFVLPASTAD